MDKQENKNIIRTCITCGLAVTNTLIVNCPRCNTALYKIEHTCVACVSQNGCFKLQVNDSKNYSDK